MFNFKQAVEVLWCELGVDFVIIPGKQAIRLDGGFGRRLDRQATIALAEAPYRAAAEARAQAEAEAEARAQAEAAEVRRQVNAAYEQREAEARAQVKAARHAEWVAERRARKAENAEARRVRAARRAAIGLRAVDRIRI